MDVDVRVSLGVRTAGGESASCDARRRVTNSHEEDAATAVAVAITQALDAVADVPRCEDWAVRVVAEAVRRTVGRIAGRDHTNGERRLADAADYYLADDGVEGADHAES